MQRHSVDLMQSSISRYDKKGQAKRDILKALHYSLLLYHFSGQLNETPTRGYETF